MTITQTGGVDVLELESEAERSAWQPAWNEALQFVRLTHNEYSIYHCGRLIGAATHLPHESAWQAESEMHGWCVAPLCSLLECAARLLEAEYGGAYST